MISPRFFDTAYVVAANRRNQLNDALEAVGLGRPFSIELLPVSERDKLSPPTHFALTGPFCFWQQRRIEMIANELEIVIIKSLPDEGQTAFERAIDQASLARRITEEENEPDPAD